VVLYEMLTGRPPFLADTAERLLRAHLEAAPRPVRALVFWVPPEIAAACEAALVKDPAARPASAGALAARLRAAAEAAQASAAALPYRTVGADRTVAADRLAEPTRRLWANQTQVVGDRRKLRRRSRRAQAAVLLGLLGVAAAVAWQTNVDRPRAVRPPAATVRQAPATRPASITVTLRYRERVWTQCKVDGRLAFDGIGTPGDRRSWTARRVDLVLGNPTGVELVVDGQVLGRPNGHGRLWRGSFQPGRPPPPLG
jgi:hypothetical protein